ncbi:MAG TPA: carbohydrate-binding domain-containing protein [Paenibacillus sp.]|uniref:carbohydrate-binding domain-containing protein n=1 Tax=Paenibacillus TaxID=44249 RepID=UPI000BA11211|nr:MULTISPECIES: carbohydrate-binding domain-containing protein [Paenibacillus]OZQ63678.1 dockerin type 1 [Paenibacillus taichungensis]HBU83820.1 carbohydrate-binding domain-containing protein [Paenibacillus sp.]
MKKKIITGSKLWSVAMITAMVTACSSPAATSSTANAAVSTTGTTKTVSVSEQTSVKYADLVTLDADDTNVSWSATDSTTIKLNGTTASITGSGAKAANGSVTISAAGTYVLSGKLTDGQIVVNVADKGTVHLVLNGATINDNDSAAIYIQKAGKAIITLEEGTENAVSDGKTYVYADDTTDEPDAAIFSKADLTFNGTGKLTVTGNYNEGITSKDDLKIISGTINVKSADDGIKGKDMVAIQAGTITVDSEGDGIKSTNDTDTTKGFVAIAGGTFNINSGSDGIQAETALVTDGGTYNIVTGGGSANAPAKVEEGPFGGGGGGWGGGTPPTDMGTPPDGEPPAGMPSNDGTNATGAAPSSSTNATAPADSNADADTSTTTTEEETTSAKALKAGVDLTVNGGTYTIDSMDDSLHSNNNVTVNDGKFSIESGDDGIHADQALTINGGTIVIAKSYEGLEGAIITLSDGDVDVTASDDGVNASGEITATDADADAATTADDSTQAADTTAVSNISVTETTGTTSTTNQADQSTDANSNTRPQGGAPGGMPGESASNSELHINGGSLTVNAGGDGLDSNGSIYMTDGTVIVNGPTDNGNGALDYDGNFELSGGYLVAAGSSGMAQATSEASTQNTIAMTFPETLKAGTLVHVEDSEGNNILTFAPAKDYQTVVISSPDLKKDGSYVIYSGGTSTGKAVDGLYTDGTYSGGTKVVAFQSTSNVTWVNESGVTTANSGMGGPGGGRGQGGFGGGRNRTESGTSGTTTDTTGTTGNTDTAK